MKYPAARKTDETLGHKIDTLLEPRTVWIERKLAACVGDLCTAKGMIAPKEQKNVTINDRPAAWVTDQVICGCKEIVKGASRTNIHNCVFSSNAEMARMQREGLIEDGRLDASGREAGGDSRRNPQSETDRQSDRQQTQQRSDEGKSDGKGKGESDTKGESDKGQQQRQQTSQQPARQQTPQPAPQQTQQQTPQQPARPQTSQPAPSPAQDISGICEAVGCGDPADNAVPDQ